MNNSGALVRLAGEGGMTMGLQLERGKFYVDRQGDLYGPMRQADRDPWRWVAVRVGSPFEEYFRDDGTWGADPRRDFEYDLVAEVGASHDTAPAVHDCARLGHDFIDNGTLRTECRHCRADGHWNREYAVYLGVP
jgi:hypothetical protein